MEHSRLLPCVANGSMGKPMMPGFVATCLACRPIR